MLARCPTCRNTFSTERSGRQDCPVCGKPLVVPEQAQAAIPALPVDEGPPGEPEGTPWERRGQLGFIPAWIQTMQQALLEPGRLFASARLDRGPAQLGFAVLTTSVFWAIGQILERALFANMHQLMQNALGSLAGGADQSAMLKWMVDTQAAANSWGWVFGLALLTPLFSLIFLYLNAGVTHGIALMLGQAKRGFPATFAACAYACAPLALMAIPGCGSIIAVVWLVVLTGIGLKRTHRISSGGAAATVLAPYLVFCCLAIVLSIALANALKNVAGQ